MNLGARHVVSTSRMPHACEQLRSVHACCEGMCLLCACCVQHRGPGRVLHIQRHDLLTTESVTRARQTDCPVRPNTRDPVLHLCPSRGRVFPREEHLPCNRACRTCPVLQTHRLQTIARRTLRAGAALRHCAGVLPRQSLTRDAPALPGPGLNQGPSSPILVADPREKTFEDLGV